MKTKKIYADSYVCPICGKEFVCTWKELWVYKGYFGGTNDILLCSWTCMRKMEAEKARTKKRKGRRKNARNISETEE